MFVSYRFVFLQIYDFIFTDEFPWQISIKNLGQHICGGSIISKNQVITAAHCIEAAQSVNKCQKPSEAS